MQFSIASSAEACPAGSIPFEQYQPFSLVDQLTMMGIDAPTILQVYLWGAGSVLMWWGIPYAVRVAQEAIRRL